MAEELLKEEKEKIADDKLDNVSGGRELRDYDLIDCPKCSTKMRVTKAGLGQCPSCGYIYDKYKSLKG